MKMHLRMLTVLLLSVACTAEPVPKVDVAAYCKLPCKEKQNVVCKYKCKVNPKCPDIQWKPFNKKEREAILQMHNEMRQRVASGKDKRGGQGSATNMMVMSYDVELEVPAMCWALQCTWAHDQCRNTPKFPKGNGQNMFQIEGTTSLSKMLNGISRMSVNSWFGEIKDMTKGQIDRFKTIDKMIGHYTQLVWWSTVYVGCARTTFACHKRKMKCNVAYLICNYSPQGNIQGMPVYQFGAPASKCRFGTKPNKIYPALCGEIVALKDKNSTDDENKKGTGSGTPMLKYLFGLLAFAAFLSLCFVN